MRSVLRVTLLLICLIQIAPTVYCEPVDPAEPADSVESVESADSTAVREPEPPRHSLGEVLLDIPGYFFQTPFLILEGVASGIVHVATGTAGGPNILQVFIDPLRAVTPIVSNGSQAGFGGGLRWRQRGLFDAGDQLRIKGTYSIYNYSLFDVKYENTAITGGRFGARVDIRYARSTRLSYYGPGNVSDLDQRVSFTIEEKSVRSELNWHPEPTVSLGVIGTWQSFGVFDGHDTDFESRLSKIRSRFDLTPEAFRSEKFFTLGSRAELDKRNHPARPTAGGRYLAEVSYNWGVGEGNNLEYVRTRAELSHYLDVWQQRTLVFRAVVQDIDRTNRVAPNPVYLQSSLGGNETLRSYHSSRFVDLDLALVTLEYRYPVWDVIDAFLFLDEGRVFQQIGTRFTFADWHHSAGFGLRVWNEEEVVGIVTIAAGKEGPRFFFQLGQVF